MDSIIDALIGIALLVIPAIGYSIYQRLKLDQLRIANQIKQEQARALTHTLSETASIAVKSTSQTIVAGQRDEAGGLPAAVAETARESARQTLKKLLSPEQLAAVRAQYGNEEGKVNQALDPLIEAAVHDLKKGDAPPLTPPKKETP